MTDNKTGVHHTPDKRETRSRDGQTWDPMGGRPDAEHTGYSGGAKVPDPQASKHKKGAAEAPLG